ncbi:MAG: chemotaxis protein CheB [Proteobacteria bacterium]|nr:chemotaxis protein CheB [Pseudomonadota bacterium]
MAHRDIIVVGASAGAWEALPKLVSGLPANLHASVLIVQHVAPSGPSYLPERLNQSSVLPAKAAVDGERLVPGHIYVAVPDRHLMIQDGRIRLSRGPKESHARPSVDVLFRSAAFDAGPRVIGIVLTGQLDDGTAGLWTIKDRGGIAIVQSPQEAQYPSMPASALAHVDVDYTLSLADMANVLAALTREEIHLREAAVSEKLEIENRIALEGIALEGVRKLGQPSFFTCPDCHGSMVAVVEGSIRRFRCHTGHGFSEQALLDQAMIKIDETLWWALAQMEEAQTLLGELAERASVPADAAARYRREVDELRRMVKRLQGTTQREPAPPAASAELQQR